MIGSRFLVLLISFAAIAASDGLLLAFSGRNLPEMDIWPATEPDAYINVYYARSASDQYELLGTTKNIGSHNPDWPELFNVPNNGGSTQMLKVDMYDADSPDSDDYMGYVEYRLMDIINDSDGLLSIDLIGGEPGGGQLLTKRQSAAKV